MSNVKSTRFLLTALLSVSGMAWAQIAHTSQSVEAGSLHFEHAVPPPMLAQSGVAVEGLRAFSMEFIGGEFGIAGKTVKNAPYSAEAVTETTQVLADGNRIRHKSSANIYRDSQGRTRRESVLGVVGLPAGAELPKLVFISDPVAGFNYVLNLKERTATRTKIAGGDRKMAVLHSRLAQGPTEDHRVEVNVEGGTSQRTEVRAFSYAVRSNDAQKGKSETLPRQNVEGVLADGTRTTFSIPAGQIGNDRAIDIVSERWYSSELETVVSSRHSDPRSGETSYRLTNISRSEPAPSLFEVPADFKVTEESGNVLRLRHLEPPAPSKE